VVSPSLTFRTDVQLVQMPAKHASGRLSSRANQMSPPSALLNSLNELNGTKQHTQGQTRRISMDWRLELRKRSLCHGLDPAGHTAQP
jgi:hypothetical protein